LAPQEIDADLNFGANLNPDVSLIQLSTSSGGVAALSRLIDGYSKLQQIHIFMRSGPGYVTLGRDVITPATLDFHAAQISRWTNALEMGGRIFFNAVGMGAAATTF